VSVPFRPFAGPEHRAFELGAGGRQALLVHGFPGTPAEMRPLAEVLAARGWRVRAPLLPCFGPDIVNLGRCRWQDWVTAIEAEWAALRVASGPCALIGYSMGAAIALHVAAARPPDRLVLVAPFWSVPGLVARAVPVLKWVLPRWRPFARADFADPALRAQLNRLLPGVDLDDPAVQDFVRREMALPFAAVHEVLRLGARAARRGAAGDGADAGRPGSL
jgi:carboxylesterase